MTPPYARGLHELGDGLHAYLQPDGGWGWSNAGLITADGASLLVDTLFDHKLTRAMLDAMAPITARSPINAAVNTHGNGDHCYGNELLAPEVKLYATVQAVQDMEAVPPSLMSVLMQADLGPSWNEFVRECFGEFSFEGIELRVPDTTFSGTLDLDVGGRRVSLVELGPAHTGGDAIVHVPDAGVVFTGDLLFIEGTPIMWAGPVANWLGALDRLLGLGAHTFVPGHGPVTGAEGAREVKRYLEYVRDEARRRFDAHMDPDEAADDIDLAPFEGWSDPERIVVNVHSLYREFDPARPAVSPAELFLKMAGWTDRHGVRD